MSRILTGIKPTGNMHIGNYFGMLKPAIDLATQHPDYEVFLFIASMHALISQHDPIAMRSQTYDLIKIFLASGGDSDRYFLYDQADVPAHAQLNRVLACITHMGFMERMHAYKDAIAKGKANEVSVGLFTYPILMAGDIILYDANYVPV
jgi:tryptophanyl-tRNA synthetase